MFDGLFIYGHRGAKGLAPENTFAACEIGVQSGADGLEVDCQPCLDEDVIIHDRTITDTDKATVSLRLITQAELLVLRSQQAQAAVPTLSQILPFSLQLPLNIEWKCERLTESAINTIHEWILEHPQSIPNLIFSSFCHPLLVQSKELFPDIARAALLYGVPLSVNELVQKLDPIAINCSIDFLTGEFISAVRQADLELNVYTVNSVPVAKELASLGVTGIFTDFPDRFR